MCYLVVDRRISGVVVIWGLSVGWYFRTLGLSFCLCFWLFACEFGGLEISRFVDL